MFDAFVSQPSYLDHMLPLWLALEPHERGAFGSNRRDLVARLKRHGVTARQVGAAPLLIVAGASDIAIGRRTKQRVVLLEHGAGQRYIGDPAGATNPSYSGGLGREEVGLFIVPNQACADANLERYPTARAVVVGSPKLETLPRPPKDGPVCLSYHWDARFVPEARWSWPHYSRSLRMLAEAMPGLIGHAHPRALERIAPFYRRAGIEVVENFADVCRIASTYCVDNSSTMYEFAALGGRVVALNCPWYRRDVEHGLRFWSNIPGPQADGPDDVARCVDEAAKPEWDARRAAGTRAIYGEVTGATQRSLEALRLELARVPGTMAR